MIHPGVYMIAGAPVTWHQSLMAAQLACPPEGGISHRAAAAVHSLLETRPSPEVAIPHRTRRALDGVIVHRATDLTAADLTVVNGIRVTRPARTIIDCAGVLDEATLVQVLDAAYGRRLISGSYLYRRLDRLGRQGRAGAGLLARLLTARPEATSVFERRLFRVLREAGLPLPTPQHEVRLPTGRKRWIDYAYEGYFLGLEANSFKFHAGPIGWARDHGRNAELVALGWSFFPVTWYDLDDPAPMLELLTRALRARGWEDHPQVLWADFPTSVAGVRSG